MTVLFCKRRSYLPYYFEIEQAVQLQQATFIAAAAVQFEDRLEGISNYLQWKVQIAFVLRENQLWSFVSIDVPVPTLDPISLDLHEVKEVRAQRIILDGVKDHLIPHLVEKLTTNEIFKEKKRKLRGIEESRRVSEKEASVCRLVEGHSAERNDRTVLQEEVVPGCTVLSLNSWAIFFQQAVLFY
eukprot:Gb_02744 [translate_table: standard]